MRIMHVITRMILGGAQENTMLCCDDLRRTFGDDVLLLTGPTTGPEGNLMDEVAGRGIPFRILPELQRAIQPWQDWQAWRRLVGEIAAFQPEVVHTHSAKAGILGRLAAHAAQTPVIVHTVHGAPFHEYQGRGGRALVRWCERLAARRCHALISVADALTERLVQAGVAEAEKFTTIYSGMELEPFLTAEPWREQMRAEWGFGPEQIVVGKVARLFPLKGHEFLIEAARAVVSAEPRVHFVLVGDGILRHQLRDRIEQLGLSSHFHLAGLVPRSQIAACFAAMDVVVHTSLREGLARALPQAMLCGKPVVSFDVDGAREVVETDVTGILVPPGDLPRLQAALLRVIRDPAWRQACGLRGRERCRQLFPHDRMTARIRELYLQLAGR